MEKTRNSRNVLIGISIFLLFVAIFVFINVSKSVEEQNLYEKANFVEVEATIVEYRKHTVYADEDTFPIGESYTTYYQYKSPDGQIYSGFWQTRIKTEGEAKAQIGKKVKIYVDNELKLDTKSLDFDKTSIWLESVLGSVCLLISFSILLYYAVLFVYWIKNRPTAIAKPNKEEKKNKPPKNYCSVHFPIIMLSVFILVASIGSSISKEKEYQLYANAQFVEVQGEIYKYSEFEKDGLLYYVTYYQYVDAEGREFGDMWQNDIYDKAEAEAAIGSAVTLYYDSNLGVLKSMDDLIKVPKPDHTFDIIVSLIFIALFTNSAVRFIRFIVRDKRYEAEQKRQREEE
jgi:heme/copper-type cytochrome/quinol oxidase subunit 2